MKSIQELNAIKEKMQQAKMGRDVLTGEDTRIVVGMATCGIAAGARPVMQKLIEEVASRNLQNVKVVQTGCIGMCRLEPIVEVYAPNKSKVTYVKVTEDMVAKIVSDHIVNGNVVTEYVIAE
ncbi:MAG: (2Fe-2S) ferredoxin domain-containing protein [Bacillota bacterium]